MIERELEQVVDQLLEKSQISLMEDLVEAVNKQLKKQLPADSIAECVADHLNRFKHFSVELSEDGQRLIYRDELFAQTVFKVKLTAEEIRDKRMYVGHRLMPFINPATEIADISLLNPDGSIISRGKAKMDFIDGMKYISLIAPYQAADYFSVEENDLILPYFDLKDWMKQVDYQQEDLLEWVPVDMSKRQYRLEKLSLVDYNRARIKTNHKDVQLLDGIYDFLDNHMVAFPVDYMLFRIFAHGPKHLLAEQGSPLGPLLTSQEDIQLYNNEYPFIHYVDFHQQLLADTIDWLEDEELPEPGTSTDLNGIFMELQTGYTEIYIRAIVLNHILQEKSLSDEELLDQLFEEEEIFDNPEQTKNFTKAMKTLREQMKEAWQNRKLELPKVSLLRKYLEVKREVFGALEDMIEDDFMMGEGNLEQIFFINGLSEQLDQTAHWLMDEFSEGEMPTNEIRTLTKQFDTILQQFRDNRSAFSNHFSDD